MPNPQTGEIMRVREDIFDSLPPDEWAATMEALEPYNTMVTMNGLFSNWTANKAARKDKRAAAKQQRVETRVQGRTERAAAGGGIGGAIKNIAGAVSNVFGKGGQEPTPATRGFEFNVGGGQTPTATKVWYQNPVIIGGAVLSLGALVYFLTKKKK